MKAWAWAFLATLLLAGGVSVAQEAAPATPATPAPAAAEPEPNCMSAEEMPLLRGLRQRHQELQEWREKLQAREQALNLLEETLDQRLVQLTQKTEELEQRLGIGEGAEKAMEMRLGTLAETLKGMKATKLAPVFEDLDTPLAVELMRLLEADQAALVLQKVKPKRAAELVAHVANTSSADRLAQAVAIQNRDAGTEAPTAPRAPRGLQRGRKK